MGKGFLSVILPNYNHGEYIINALNSIQLQSYEPKEVIVIDDASTDSSVEIIEEFIAPYPNIKLIRNKQNKGPVFSANRALKYVSGDYVYGAAADDILLPGIFAKSMELLLKYPTAGLCCSDSKTIWKNTGCVTINKRNLGNKACYIAPDEIRKIMRNKILYISGFTSIVKRTALIEAGGYLEELKWSSDRFFSLIIALRHGICYIPEPLAVQSRIAESYSENGVKNELKHKKIIENVLKVLKSHKYYDVLPGVKYSAALSCFGMPLLYVIISNKRYWEFLTFNLVRLTLCEEFKNRYSNYFPSFMKVFYRILRNFINERIISDIE